MKYMTGLCSKHLPPLRLASAQGFRRMLYGRCSAIEFGFHLPAATPDQVHHDQCGEKQGNEQHDGKSSGRRHRVRASTSQMQAAASHASAMPPRNDCSADRQDFSFSLRMAALSVRLSGPALGR